MTKVVYNLDLINLFTMGKDSSDSWAKRKHRIDRTRPDAAPLNPPYRPGKESGERPVLGGLLERLSPNDFANPSVIALIMGNYVPRDIKPGIRTRVQEAVMKFVQNQPTPDNEMLLDFVREQVALVEREILMEQHKRQISRILTARNDVTPVLKPTIEKAVEASLRESLEKGEEVTAETVREETGKIVQQFLTDLDENPPIPLVPDDLPETRTGSNTQTTPPPPHVDRQRETNPDLPDLIRAKIGG